MPATGIVLLDHRDQLLDLVEREAGLVFRALRAGLVGLEPHARPPGEQPRHGLWQNVVTSQVDKTRVAEGSVQELDIGTDEVRIDRRQASGRVHRGFPT